MPLKTFGCSTCGKQAPTRLRQEGKLEERFAWLRRHYKIKHPEKFRKWYK